MEAYIREALNDGAYNVYIEAVHRLSDLGAVITQVSNGTSQQGFDGEWRTADVLTVEGNLINRCEIFDEADLDAALARFNELQPQAPRLENAASQAWQRFQACLAAEDWAAMAEILADDSFLDDRRRVVNGGLWGGRHVVIENLRATADFTVENLVLVATRGGRLVLSRFRWSSNREGPDTFHTEALCLVEVDADDRIAATVVFDPDEIDAAFAELDARYLAGEAAAYAQTWSVISESYAAFNRREHFPSASDWVNIDRRRLSIIEEGDLTATVQAAWDLTPDISARIAAVHRLTNLGAVVTQSTHGTSQEGFDAEWRLIQLLTVDGGLVKHGELFDEADLDAAIARFDELDRPSSP
jgi:hypothetical protein